MDGLFSVVLYCLAMTGQKNVLLVVLDSVRAKNTSLHGYERETTPFLSSFAGRATLYRQARAPGIHSIASHVSMFTGSHVEQHRAIHHTAQIDPTETVWRELSDRFGYATGLFTNNRIVASASNLSDAFEHVHHPSYPLIKRLESVVDETVLKKLYFYLYGAGARLSQAIRRLETRSSTVDRLSAAVEDWRSTDTDDEPGFKSLYGGEFTDAFLQWEAGQSSPWAACINLMDAHSPYQPREEFDHWGTDRHREIQRGELPSVWETMSGEGWDRVAALEHLYDGAIQQADAIVSELIAALERRGALSETVVIITSDHGEAFGERSRLDDRVRLRGHKWGIHEVLTHVPLVVSYPGQTGGRVVDTPVSLTDIPALGRAAATEADPAAARPLADTDRVLASTFQLREKKLAKYSSVENNRAYVGPWRAVYEPGEDGTVRKFARHDDRSLALLIDNEGEPDPMGDSGEALDRITQAYGPIENSEILTQETAEIDDELEQRLEDLGYIR